MPQQLRRARPAPGPGAARAGQRHNTTSSHRAATARASSAAPPRPATSCLARPVPASETSTPPPHPRASARAILPAPIRPTCMGGERYPQRVLRLVEEALLDEPCALLGGDLDIARGE